MKYRIFSKKHNLYTDDPAYPVGTHVDSWFFVDQNGNVQELVTSNGIYFSLNHYLRQEDYNVEVLPTKYKTWSEISKDLSQKVEAHEKSFEQEFRDRVYDYLYNLPYFADVTIKRIQSSLKNSKFSNLKCNDIYESLYSDDRFCLGENDNVSKITVEIP